MDNFFSDIPWMRVAIYLFLSTLVLENGSTYLRLKYSLKDGYSRKINHKGIMLITGPTLVFLPDAQLISTVFISLIGLIAIYGIPAPGYRGTIWNNSAKRGKPFLAHTDWPQIKYSKLEFEHVKTPVAINFYPKHPANGASILRLYNLIPEESWLDDLGIKSSGYPISQEQLEGVHYIDIQPEEGDILLFNAAHVQAVNNQSVLDEQNDSNQHRLNINGFLGYCEQLNRVLAWA